MEYQEGDLLWIFPHEELSWAIGEVMQKIEDGYIVRVKDYPDIDQYKVLFENAHPVHESCLEGVQDLLWLGDFNEGSLLQSVRARYANNQFYTSIGDPILISINPYKPLSIYSQAIQKQYRNQNDNLPPHLFQVAQRAYDCLMGANQSIVISGESGAGKTEAAKYIMQYLASAASEGGITGIEQKVLDSNPILEAFGNAKTLRNNNSSRFGKFVEVHFDHVSLRLVAAFLKTYLLEKSRIVTQQEGERNYHIFYQLCAGAENDAYHIRPAHDFDYLVRGNCTEIEQVDDIEGYEITLKCMQEMGLSQLEIDQIFKTTMAVLYIGNISFVGEDQAQVLDQEPLQIAAELLELNPEDLERSFTNRVFLDPRSKQQINIPQSPEQAEVNRDSIAKEIYSKIFDYIVTKLNEQLFTIKNQKTRIIGLLDIYGFEVFDENSYEQFCINYANEKLQQHFNSHIFKLEQQEYQKERIKWDHIQYEDNQDCIDLIEKKNMSIISLLEQQCKLQRESDQEFLSVLYKSLGNHPRICNPGAFAQSHFGIAHYAGDVYYNSQGFIEKNKNYVNPLLIQISQLSLGLLRTLFQEKPQEVRRGQKKAPSQPQQNLNLAAQFKQQLHDLMKILSSASPWYIRCIKPNENKSPTEFNSIEVHRQLKCAGMLESIQIRKAGYSARRTVQEFVQKYKILIKRQIQGSGISQCKEIFVTLLKQPEFAQILDPAKRNWQIGVSKIFLKDEVLDMIEQQYRQAIIKYAVVIQKNYKGYKQRIWFTKIVKLIVSLQKKFKRNQFRRRINKRADARQVLRICMNNINASLVLKAAKEAQAKKQLLMQEIQNEILENSQSNKIIQQENLQSNIIVEDKNEQEILVPPTNIEIPLIEDEDYSIIQPSLVSDESDGVGLNLKEAQTYRQEARAKRIREYQGTGQKFAQQAFQGELQLLSNTLDQEKDLRQKAEKKVQQQEYMIDKLTAELNEKWADGNSNHEYLLYKQKSESLEQQLEEKDQEMQSLREREKRWRDMYETETVEMTRQIQQYKLQLQKQQPAQNSDKLIKQIKDLKHQISEQEDEIDALEQENQKLLRTVQTLQQDAIDQQRESQSALKKRVQEMQFTIDEAQRNQQRAEQKAEMYNQQLQQKSKELTTKQSYIQQLEQEQENQHKEKIRLNRELTEALANLEYFKQMSLKVDENQEIEELRQELEDVTYELEESKEVYTIMVNMLKFKNSEIQLYQRYGTDVPANQLSSIQTEERKLLQALEEQMKNLNSMNQQD